MIAEAGQVELEALGFDQPITRRVVDDKVREIGLARDQTQGREFRRNKAREIERVGMRICHPLELCCLGALRLVGLLAELAQPLIDRIVSHIKGSPVRE